MLTKWIFLMKKFTHKQIKHDNLLNDNYLNIFRLANVQIDKTVTLNIN